MKLKQVRFNEKRFRKLSSLTLDIGNRLTAIGGLNGIGKTTILGLIANCSGIRDARYRSYFDKTYQAQFQELFHLSIDNDYIESVNEKSYVDFVYETDQGEFIKRCSVTKHKDKGIDRLKVVPRTVTKELGKELGIGPDKKMPIPTIYLGMSRMHPMGEVEAENIKTTKLKSISSEDKDYLIELFSEIGQFDINSEDTSIIDHDVKFSNKRFKLPALKHDTLSISLGQDSLSSIFTALASFKRIKREYEGYQSGILVIDELDAGLHHSVQIKLLQLLKKEARKLNLQVIFTTHSLTIFKELLNIPDKQQIFNNIPDKVIYLYDSYKPKVHSNITYLNIKNNQMTKLTQHTALSQNRFYFEDDEAKWFFESVCKVLGFEDIKTSFNIDPELVSLKLGSNTLLSLAKADSFFKKVIVVLDNDVMSSEEARKTIVENPNFIALPGSDTFTPNTPSRLRTPEKIIYDYLDNKVKNYDDNFWENLSKTNNQQIDFDYVKDAVLTVNVNQSTEDAKFREIMKSWFKSHKQLFDKIHIVELFAKENPNEISKFKSELITAIQFVSQHSSN